jgi:hypothetical protein
MRSCGFENFFTYAVQTEDAKAGHGIRIPVQHLLRIWILVLFFKWQKIERQPQTYLTIPEEYWDRKLGPCSSLLTYGIIPSFPSFRGTVSYVQKIFGLYLQKL